MVEISAEWVVAIATVIYVFATILILIANNKTNKLTQKQLEIHNKQFLEDNRPIVTIALVADGSLALLRIRNEGNRIAENVRISCIQQISINGNDDVHFIESLKKMCEKTMTLASQSQWDLSVAVTWRLKDIVPADVDFRIQYICGGKEYELMTTIRFTSFNWARSYRDGPEVELRAIKENIWSCRNEFQRIREVLESDRD